MTEEPRVSTRQFIEPLMNDTKGSLNRICLGMDLARAFFDVHDKVEFKDRLGQLKQGEIIKLNPSRASLQCGHEKWNVPYLHLDHACSATAIQRFPRAQRLRQMAIEARRLMDKYGLAKWGLEFSSAESWLGSCDNKRKRIKLSVPHALRLSTMENKDTILHEIAHARVGHAAGHGPKWQAMAKQIGARPIRCYSSLSKEDIQQQIDAKKATFRVGDWVEFLARRRRYTGKVSRMNPKTAKVQTSAGDWRVPYTQLKKVARSQ